MLDRLGGLTGWMSLFAMTAQWLCLLNVSDFPSRLDRFEGPIHSGAIGKAPHVVMSMNSMPELDAATARCCHRTTEQRSVLPRIHLACMWGFGESPRIHDFCSVCVPANSVGKLASICAECTPCGAWHEAGTNRHPWSRGFAGHGPSKLFKFWFKLILQLLAEGGTVRLPRP